jgi:hypothetical protein
VAALAVVHFDAFAFNHDQVGGDAFDLDNELLLGDGACPGLIDELCRVRPSAGLVPEPWVGLGFHRPEPDARESSTRPGWMVLLLVTGDVTLDWSMNRDEGRQRDVRFNPPLSVRCICFRP